jgi:uncharacterized protein YjiS (DUF1127 family)
MMHATTATEPIAGGHVRRAVQRETMLALWRLVTSFVAGAASAFLDWRRRKHAITELHDLSDRMLSDIGIKRYDIERIVWNGRGAGEIGR